MSHLVGVSSILATLRTPAELVAAGLLHSAYSDGEFGDGSRGLADWKRDEVRMVVGREIEESIARYCSTAWIDESLPAVLAGLATSDPRDQTVFLMRLANELEDNLDGGVLYAPNARTIQTGIVLFGDMKLKLAERLGYPALAFQLALNYQINGTASIPVHLQRTGSGTRSYAILPLTYANPLPLRFGRSVKIRTGSSLHELGSGGPAGDSCSAGREFPEVQQDAVQYAETNIQLYKQMREAGYSSRTVTRVHETYELALRLFAGQFQVHGKTVIAHIVGTASILVSLRVPPTVIVAALLHNAYWGGDFGDGKSGITGARRRFLRCRFGDEVEGCLAGFAQLQIHTQTASTLLANVDAMSETDRRIALLYLADNLEHNGGAGVLYYGEAQRSLYLDSEKDRWADLASALGFQTLADQLALVHRRNSATQLPWALTGKSPRTSTLTLVPRRTRKRLPLVVREIVRSAFGHCSRRLQQSVG
jgi:hypothetical protein